MRYVAVATKDHCSEDAFWWQIRDTVRGQNLLGYYYQVYAELGAKRLNNWYEEGPAAVDLTPDLTAALLLID